MTKSNKPLRAMMFVGMIGMDLAVMTIGGFWLGRLLDRRFGTEPAFLIVGVLAGLGLAIFSIMKMIQPFLGEQDD